MQKGSKKNLRSIKRITRGTRSSPRYSKKLRPKKEISIKPKETCLARKRKGLLGLLSMILVRNNRLLASRILVPKSTRCRAIVDSDDLATKEIGIGK